MKEKPIIFNTENVKAILEGRKTQTRRILKPQPPEKASVWLIENGNTGEKHFEVRRCNPWHTIVCPYGQVGDSLWVRETWCAGCADEPERCACYKVLDDGRLPKNVVPERLHIPISKHMWKQICSQFGIVSS